MLTDVLEVEKTFALTRITFFLLILKPWYIRTWWFALYNPIKTSHEFAFQ